ncbi:MAG TPA: acyl-CoA thioesterase [Bacillus bacterium]|nr:acyl-CoA thioesterase [Bacillus sp. (in: firmicutes)]
MQAHTYEFRVEWGDTDAAGIVYNPNFYKWMDQAVHYYFESIGFPLLNLVRDEKIGIPVIESKCNFQKPLYFADHVVLHTNIIGLHNKVIKFGHIFMKEGNKIAEGYQVRALASFDGEKLQAITIPDRMRQAIMESGVIEPSQV